MSETLYSFGSDGKIPVYVTNYNGIVYGSTLIGGNYNKGTLFKCESDVVTTLYHFDDINGSRPISIVVNNNVIYGTTFFGGTTNQGVLFGYNLVSATLTVLKQFTITGTSLVGFVHNSHLYVTTEKAGSYSKGNIFTYNLVNGAETTVHEFNGTDGNYPNCIRMYKGVIYGSTYSGKIFKFDGSLSLLHSFNGEYPMSIMIENGIIYGFTYNGGEFDKGSIFKIDSGITILHSFNGENGMYPISAEVKNGIIYGITYVGGSYNTGLLFKFDSGITTLTSFTSVNGANPRRITMTKDALYGVTYFGGTFDNGTLFKYDIATIPISTTCFPAGTLITTDQGDIAIDKIVPFETTIRKKAIKAITRTILQDSYLICIEKDALGINYPNKKTIISRNHKIMHDGKLTKVYKLVGRYKKIQPIVYTKEIMYNVLMDVHDVMKVNNLTCETLHPENSIAKMFKRSV